jgi:pyruvate/2-oxoglutarate dehydrogenase complex dihydrolipoamide acyltransferase (E2) component
MTDSNNSYTSLPFPAGRKVIVDAGRWGSRRHLIHALLEIDVTQARLLMQDHKTRTGKTLSFTGFLVKCLAQAIETHPAVQAYRDWRNHLIIFEDVDVVTLIETQVGGVALPHVIRSANRKSFCQIHDEIRAVQERPPLSPQKGGLVNLAPHLPAFVRDIFYWALHMNPHWFKQIQGTTIITSVGMFGQGGGWGFGFLPFHTLGLTVGGIADKPGVVDGRIEVRQMLDLTISFDHDVVDGADAARFANALKGLIEKAVGLDEQC